MEQNVAGLTFFEQAWAWFETNKKQVAVGAVIAAVVGVIVAYFVWSQGAKEVNAGEALSSAMAGNWMSGNQAESPEAYLKVASSHAKTRAGARALLAAAGALFTQGKYAEAQAQFEKFSREYADSPFRGEAMLGVAASLDAQSKTEEAARAYKEIIDRRANESVVPQAKFSLARIYESQNKIKEARDLYEDIARDNSRAPGASSIMNEAAMKAEELRSKQPAPVAASVPAVTSTASPTFQILSQEPTAKTNKP